MALITLEDPARRTPPTGWAPFALGFRPFFLAAGLYAVVMMALWLGVLNGKIQIGSLSPIVWHAHEMVFGFTVAVIAGFLLTAARNWTGLPTPSGPALVALFLLWLAGRVSFFIPGLPIGTIALLDLLFLPVLAVVLARPILKARQFYNFPFPLMLLVLATANVLVHIEALGRPDALISVGLHLAVYVIVVMIAVMGGRVIPSFTDNKLGSHARRWKAIEILMPLTTIGALLAVLIAPRSPATALIATAAACVHGVRLAGWYTPRFWSVPLLWVLHLGYAWIPIGFLLLAFSAAGLNPMAAGSALHAFTAGAIGVLTLGMMARVSLGHTGRMLEPARLMTLAFAALNLAALIRVGMPLIAPDMHGNTMLLAGLLWMMGFGLFAAIYASILLRPRVDGKPG